MVTVLVRCSHILMRLRAKHVLVGVIHISIGSTALEGVLRHWLGRGGGQTRTPRCQPQNILLSLLLASWLRADVGTSVVYDPGGVDLRSIQPYWYENESCVLSSPGLRQRQE
jgi:hypothetical protein